MNPKDPQEIDSQRRAKREDLQVPESPVPSGGQEQEPSEHRMRCDASVEGAAAKPQPTAECPDKQALSPAGTKDQVGVIGHNRFEEQHQSCPAGSECGVGTMGANEAARIVQHNAVHPKPEPFPVQSRPKPLKSIAVPRARPRATLVRIETPGWYSTSPMPAREPAPLSRAVGLNPFGEHPGTHSTAAERRPPPWPQPSPER
jgi:hypothetical protein